MGTDIDDKSAVAELTAARRLIELVEVYNYRRTAWGVSKGDISTAEIEH